MASLTQWTWVWVDSGNWWWTGKPGMLRFMGSQRVRHDWTTELNWTECSVITCILTDCVCAFVCVLVVQSCPTLWLRWTLDHQASPSMDFFRQAYWIWLNLFNPGIKSRSPALQVDSLLSEPPEKSFLLVAYTKWSLKLSEPMHCSLVFSLSFTFSLLRFSTGSLLSLIVHAFCKYHFHYKALLREV